MQNISDKPELTVAKKKDLDTILQLVREYHDIEGIKSKSSALMNAVYPLLKKDNEHGRVLLINLDNKAIGYIAFCFGYSLEFGGRDAFIDELYIQEKYRGSDIGGIALAQCKSIAKGLAIKALHLEVRSSANKLQALYQSTGFESRKKYHLMTCKL